MDQHAFLSGIVNDKSKKNKERTLMLSRWLIKNPGKMDELLQFAEQSKDTVKATCIEAIEFATKEKPEFASVKCLGFISNCLNEKAPRVKWESARVIGNIAHLHPLKLGVAVSNLLSNAEHPGTVVRWRAAYALGQIIKMKTSLNKELIPAVESICRSEEQNSIRKIYEAALKAVRK